MSDDLISQTVSGHAEQETFSETVLSHSQLHPNRQKSICARQEIIHEVK